MGKTIVVPLWTVVSSPDVVLHGLIGPWQVVRALFRSSHFSGAGGL